MKKLLIMFLLLSVSANADFLASNPPEKTHTFLLEGLGKATLWSLNYEKMVAKAVSLGVGFSYFGTGSTATFQKQISIPIFASFYLSRYFYFLEGFTSSVGFIQIDKVTYGGIGASGFVGAGFEYQMNSGLLFRITPYLLITNVPIPWLGASIGWSFP